MWMTHSWHQWMTCHPRENLHHTFYILIHVCTLHDARTLWGVHGVRDDVMCVCVCVNMAHWWCVWGYGPLIYIYYTLIDEWSLFIYSTRPMSPVERGCQHGCGVEGHDALIYVVYILIDHTHWSYSLIILIDACIYTVQEPCSEWAV